MEIAAAFFSGVILFNAVPHIVKGICGEKNMTPFGSKSSALVNIIWGWANLVVGVILARVAHIQDCCISKWIALGAGGFLVSVFLAFLWSNPEARLPWHRKASKT